MVSMLELQKEFAFVQCKLPDAEKLLAVTSAQLDSANSTIHDLRQQLIGVKTQAASLTSELTSLKEKWSETDTSLRSMMVAKDEIREKLAERDSTISQYKTEIARLTSQLEESQKKMAEYREAALMVPDLQQCISTSKHQLDTFGARYKAGKELVSDERKTSANCSHRASQATPNCTPSIFCR